MATVTLEVPDELREMAAARGKTAEGVLQGLVGVWMADALPRVPAASEGGYEESIPRGISLDAVRYARQWGILSWLLYTWRLACDRFPYAEAITADVSADPEDGGHWISIRVIVPVGMRGFIQEYLKLNHELARDLPLEANGRLCISYGRR